VKLLDLSQMTNAPSTPEQTVPPNVHSMARPMRIVDICSHYTDVGGGVRTYHQQKLAYFRHRPQYSYALIAPGDQNRTREVPGGRIHYVRGAPVQAKDSPTGYRIILDANRVRSVFKMERPDAVEIGAPYFDPWFAKLARLYCDPVFVGFYHLEFRDAHIEPWIASWPGWMRRATMGFFDWSLKLMYKKNMHATFVASECVQRELAEVGVDNTILTPLGVDTDKFHPDRRDASLRGTWKAAPGDRVLLHAGRLSVEKGTHVVLAAAERLLEDPTVHVVVAGRGGLEERVIAMDAEHERFHYMGYVTDRERLGAIFASSDAYLGTGPYETFGLSILEALSSGLPVVATDEGAGTELALNSSAGVVFRAGDAESLVERTRELLSRDLVFLRKRARRYAERNGSWTHTFDVMFMSYAQLLKLHRGEQIRFRTSEAGRTRREDRAAGELVPVPVHIHSRNVT
jgi:alpha-1,6-mannosyltransferase